MVILMYYNGIIMVSFWYFYGFINRVMTEILSTFSPGRGEKVTLIY